jgi:hypothetical protein
MPSTQLNDFDYNNTEIKQHQSGGKVVRKVYIKKGRGYKSISKYHRKKHIGTVRKTLKKSEIRMIKCRKFIPGLFDSCKQ